MKWGVVVLVFLSSAFMISNVKAEEPVPKQKPIYCEIIGRANPAYIKDGVIFDIGQKTSAVRYNWIKDAEGKNMKFGSMIEALNYVSQFGWEFVQAYTSAEDNGATHYILKLNTENLSQEELIKATSLATTTE